MKERMMMICIQAVSAFLIGGGVLLGYLSKKKMGVLRSLTYRNMKFEALILSPQGPILMLAACLSLWVVSLILKKKGQLHLSNGRAFYLMIINSGMLMSYFYYKFSTFMGGPWIFMGFVTLCLGSGLITLLTHRTVNR